MLIRGRAAAVPPTRTVPGIRYWRCRSAASSRSQSESSSMGATMGALSHETSCRPTARLSNDLIRAGQQRLRDGQPIVDGLALEHRPARVVRGWRERTPGAAGEKRVGKAAVSRLNRLGMVTGVLFFGLFALSGVAAVLTLVALVATLLGRRGLGISVLLWFWCALLALWALGWPLMRWTTRMERSPARREAEREFP